MVYPYKKKEVDDWTDEIKQHHIRWMVNDLIAENRRG
jgi:hypothetical protein